MKVFFLLFVLTALPNAAASQDVNHQLHFAHEHNWFLRVIGDTSGIIEGRVTFQNDRFVINNRVIQPQDVRQIDRRVNVGGGWKVGAIIGAGVAVLFIAGWCEYDCDGDQLAGVAWMSVAGGLLGGVIGQLSRPPQRQWIPVWP